MRSSTWVWVVIIVIILIGGVWYFTSMSSVPADQGTATDQTVPTDQTTTGTSTDTSATTAPMTATVTYDGSSYSPSSVTIAKGGTVTFTSTAGNMWVASDPHPTHEGYDGTTRAQHCVSGYTGAAPFDQCASGTSFTFTFTKTGSFGYHNHMNSSVRGTVVVQ